MQSVSSSIGFVIVILFVSLLGACDSADSTGKGESSNATEPSKEEKAAREARAQSAYGDAHVEEPDQKIAALSGVAHLYWDTESGAKAWEELIFVILDQKVLDQDLLRKELGAFANQRPESTRMMNACSMATSGVHKRFDALEPGTPERKALESLHAFALEKWVAAATLCLGDEQRMKDYQIIVGCGEAMMLAGRAAEAEAIWARVEKLEPLPIATLRISALVRRADLLRTKLDRKDDAKKLFELAESLTPALDVQTDDVLGKYIRDALAELAK